LASRKPARPERCIAPGQFLAAKVIAKNRSGTCSSVFGFSGFHCLNCRKKPQKQAFEIRLWAEMNAKVPATAKIAKKSVILNSQNG
jgi:hypothetical protein